MKLIIHRGNTEIGASCVEIRSSSNASIFIDAGSELYGERAELPSAIKTADAIFLSHAHPDHFGLLGGVPQNITIYCGQITETILKVMIAFNDDKFEKIDRNFSLFKNKEEIKIKDISITPFLTDHSVPDSYAFLVKADGKSLFYSGDFRKGGRKTYCTSNILKSVKSPDVLIADCTCIEERKDAIRNEFELEEKISQLLSDNPTLPAFALFSSINVDRIVTFFKAALHNKRIFVCDIYTALILWVMAKNNVNVPKITWDNVKVLSRDDIAKQQRYSLEGCFKDLDVEDFRDIIYRTNVSVKLEEIAKAPEKYLLKFNQIRNVQEACGFEKLIAIYSMWSGYLSPEFDKLGRYKDLINDENVIFKKLHTGGHSEQKDLLDFIANIAPKKFVPFHTNAPEKFSENLEVCKKMPQMNIFTGQGEIEI